jgi:hypothetical protein
MEDLILVNGCTLVDSWAAVTFVGRAGSAEISLVAQTPDRSERSFEFPNIQGDVTQHCSYFNSVSFSCPVYSPGIDFLCCKKDNPPPDQCVFIKGFRAKRRLFWTVPIRAAAEPLPDEPDNSREDGIQVNRVPDAPKVGSPPVVR